MPAPTPQILIDLGYIDSTSAFILDDGTKGRLDNSTYRLADVRTDVTGEARDITIVRGRTSQLFDAIDTGTVGISFNNHDRRFDPSFAAGDFYNGLMPDRDIQILVSGLPIFTGVTDDINLDYAVGGQSLAFINGVDALGQLARTSTIEWTTTAGQAPYARLNALLGQAEVAWPEDKRLIDSGVSTLQGDTVAAGTNGLVYAQLIAQTDLGFLFADVNGNIVFIDRHSLVNSAPTVTFGGSGIRYVGITASVGSETFYTRVVVERDGGTPQIVTTDAERKRTLTLSGLLFSADAEALELATYLLGLYSQPEYRIASITLALEGLSSGQQLDVLGLDIGSIVSVEFTPNNVAPAITQTCIVQGVEDSLSPTIHRRTLHLIPADVRSMFVLDSSTLGVLDDDRLGF